MSLQVQSTEGFPVALGTFVASIAALGLTAGTNLFNGDMLQTDRLADQDIVAYFDSGYTQLPARHLRVEWSITFMTSRKMRPLALEALRPIASELLNERRFLAVYGSDRFRIIRTVVSASPQINQVLDNGRFLAELTMSFEAIPL